MGLFENARGLWASYKFKRSPLGQALTHHVQEYFYSGHILSWTNQANKDKFVEDFYGKLVECEQSENSAMALRVKLVEHTLLYSQHQILCLTSKEKSEHFFAANPYITGEISEQIMEAAEHVEEAKQFIWQHNGATVEELNDFANTRSALMLFYANGFNIARIAIGDSDPAKDWFLPFVEAQMVWQEDHMRQALALPRLLSSSLDGVEYLMMMEYVLNGERNPFFTFRQNFPTSYLAGEGDLTPTV